jgi:ribose transport system permease protein
MAMRIEARPPAASRRDERAHRPLGLIGQALPAIALMAMFLVCVGIEPTVLSIDGLALLLSPAVPLILAGMSQMFVITVGDIDLGNGYLIGLVTAVVAVHLTSNPGLAVVMLLGIGILYVGQAVLVQVRGIPSIIVTLGASFVWLGLGLALLPTPGGQPTSWLVNLMNLTMLHTTNYELPIPMSLIFAALIGTAGYVLVVRLPYGAIIRAVGSNPDALRRAGWSVLKARMAAYACAAFFAIVAGLALAGVISGGDPTTSANYTPLAIAAVILGGGQFSGGRAVPYGVVVGALAISLVTSMLSLLNVPSSYQTGVQGLVLIAVLAGRVLTDRGEA